MTRDVDDRTEKSIRAKQTARLLIVGALVGVLAWWAIANTDEVSVDWLVDSTEAPLVVVIVVSAAVGFVVGFLASRRTGS